MFDCGNLSNQVLATIGQAFVSAGEPKPECPEEHRDLETYEHAYSGAESIADSDTYEEIG